MESRSAFHCIVGIAIDWLAKINNEIPTYVIQSLPLSPLCLSAILEKDMWPRLGSSYFLSAVVSVSQTQKDQQK